MDPWDPKAQSGPYTRRRISRAAIPRNPSERQIEAFAKCLEDALVFGKELGRRLLLSGRVQDPANFILSRAQKLPRHRGKRLAIAAVILHQALLQVEEDVNDAWDKVHWRAKQELKERRRAIRGPLQAMAQNLLTQSWARIPRDLRQLVFESFKTPDGRINDVWQRICRGSLSAAFVARAFQGIQTTSQVRKERCRSIKKRCLRSGELDPVRPVCEEIRAGTCQELSPTCASKDACPASSPRRGRGSSRWQVYWPTDREDRWGKIDLVATGRIKGLGKIGLCIQVKTGEEPRLEVLTQEPSDIRGPSKEHEDVRDQLWDGVEDFKTRHPEIGRAKMQFFPAMIQTGRASAPVTWVAENTKSVRALVEKMLAQLESDLKDKRRRERIYREIDRPGLKPRKRT